MSKFKRGTIDKDLSTVGSTAESNLRFCNASALFLLLRKIDQVKCHKIVIDLPSTYSQTLPGYTTLKS